MITILLVDDNRMFRSGLEKILSGHEIVIIGEAYTGAQGMACIQRHKQKTLKQPDLILLNMQLPDMPGEKLCHYFHRYWPTIPLIFLMNTVHWPTLSRLLVSSARGFLTKEACFWCPDAIKTVLTGKTYLQPDLALELLQYRSCSPLPRLEKLSAREYEVLIMLTKGKTYDEIASSMPISIKTIYNIKTRAFKKLAIETYAQLKGLM